MKNLEIEVQGMTGMSRCPGCFKLPAVKVDAKDFSITLECAQHGHMAIGSSLDSARVNWNHYISFVAKAA